MVGVLFVSLAVFFLIGVPIAFSLGLASLITLLVRVPPIPLEVIPQRIIVAADSFPLMAVPFFLLAGNLMESGGISNRLIKFAGALVGHVRGGMSFVAVLASVFFGGISGSAVADTTAIGSITIPAMLRRGYNKGFVAAVQGAAGTIGVLIPPSVPLIVYGVSVGGVSIGDLFIGGIIPGLMMAIILILVSYIIAIKMGYEGEARPTIKETVIAFKESILALLMPLIIIVGIRTGIFNPTESAVVAVIYSLIISKFVYKELSWQKIHQILIKTAISTGVIMIIIATASLFGWLLTIEQIPQWVSIKMMSITSSKIVFLVLLNIILLIVGTFLETNAAIIMLAPLLYPIAAQYDINLVHFGLLMIVNLAVGMITPPLGVTLLISCGITNVSLSQTLKYVCIYLLAMILVLLLITFIPNIVLLLPNLLN